MLMLLNLVESIKVGIKEICGDISNVTQLVESYPTIITNLGQEINKWKNGTFDVL